MIARGENLGTRLGRCWVLRGLGIYLIITVNFKENFSQHFLLNTLAYFIVSVSNSHISALFMYLLSSSVFSNFKRPLSWPAGRFRFCHDHTTVGNNVARAHTYTYMQTHRAHADVGVLSNSSHYKAQATTSGRSLQNGRGI